MLVLSRGLPVRRCHYLPLRGSYRNLPFSAHSGESLGASDLSPIPRLIAKRRWDDPRLAAIFSSASAPISVCRILWELQEDPRSAFHFFIWAGKQSGFCHTVETRCVAVHVLFRGRWYSEAQKVLKDIVLSTRVSDGSESIVDVLRTTARGYGTLGYGVFDALFGVLTDLGMLDEASDCFYRMRAFRVLPKLRSCNNLLRRLVRTGRGELSKSGQMEEARNTLAEMINNNIIPDEAVYNCLISKYHRMGNMDEVRSLQIDMRRRGIIPSTMDDTASDKI
ncbi:hypothetical protein OPV22_007933 [Ensete ventricosum]|uniref:Pentacotripeptide-repeat region of PRORP domain-containing protein n=1 Tax=Ensete ventricosum TaxID=4639 RepID=A0AAV8RET4_ENSVE|nr:hypothetical protein OPV22_007933 [Ensete ventricosum]